MTENNDTTRIKEKILKLLALAKDKGATPGEAANAARQAEAMLRKYNLEMAEVIKEELKDKDNLVWAFVRSNMFKNNKAFIKKIQDWPQWIAVPCAELYDCHVSRRLVKEEGFVIAFFGYKTDVEVCCWVFDYLLDCVRKTSLSISEYEAASHGLSIRKYRDSFRDGMAIGIMEQLKEAVRRKQGLDKKDSTCTALVISKRKAVEEKFGPFEYSPNKSTRTVIKAAFHSGVDAGRKININPNPISKTPTTSAKRIK